MTLISACLRFIGARHMVTDIAFNLANFVYVPRAAASAPTANGEAPDWASVLYVGSGDDERRATDVAYTQATKDFLENQRSSREGAIPESVEPEPTDVRLRR